jgi:hypothetical protein
MDDLDIWRTAKILIDAHGHQTAWQRALQRAVELAGDDAGQAVWLGVVGAIDELTRGPRVGEAVQ